MHAYNKVYCLLVGDGKIIIISKSLYTYAYVPTLHSIINYLRYYLDLYTFCMVCILQ